MCDELVEVVSCAVVAARQRLAFARAVHCAGSARWSTDAVAALVKQLPTVDSMAHGSPIRALLLEARLCLPVLVLQDLAARHAKEHAEEATAAAAAALLEGPYGHKHCRCR